MHTGSYLIKLCVRKIKIQKCTSEKSLWEWWIMGGVVSNAVEFGCDCQQRLLAYARRHPHSRPSGSARRRRKREGTHPQVTLGHRTDCFLWTWALLTNPGAKMPLTAGLPPAVSLTSVKSSKTNPWLWMQLWKHWKSTDIVGVDWVFRVTAGSSAPPVWERWSSETAFSVDQSERCRSYGIESKPWHHVHRLLPLGQDLFLDMSPDCKRDTLKMWTADIYKYCINNIVNDLHWLLLDFYQAVKLLAQWPEKHNS